MAEKKITNFALNPDEETLRQFEACYSQSYVVSASLMPDAHPGYVAPIGAVLATKGYLVPAWVGYDIGCGVTAVRLPKNALGDLKKRSREIYGDVRKVVPMGLGMINKSEEVMSEKIKKEFKKILSDFKKSSYNKQVLQFLESGKAMRNLGTLGHGNHFISLNEDEKGYPWIVVHSGSRSVGHWVAKFYMKKSSNDELEFEATHPLSIDSDLGKEYFNLLEFGLEFAKLNRLEMIYRVVSVIENILGKKIKFTIWANKNHNHAIKERGLFIHRKGATPAKRGERGIIPANMREGSFLVVGKGNSDFISSSSHGAGRILSRRQARESLDPIIFQKEMDTAGVVGNFSESSLDEAPNVYKDIYSVLDMQKKSVSVVNHLRPFINWQGEGRHNASSRE
ncbi:MAG: RtcB family protein [Nanoarchaeota archaeon]|nr:RtcB family protein [Nanoarchaeota archaeon]